MTDLWADERRAMEIGTGDYLYMSLKNVLTDADALLTLKEYAGHKQSCELPEAGVRGICDCGFTQALADLPEKLRDEDQEYKTPSHLIDLMSGDLTDADDVSPPHGLRYEEDE